MILLNSQAHDRLKEALLEAHRTGNPSAWIGLLNNQDNSATDGFLALLDFGFPGELFATTPFHSLDDWLARAEQWRTEILEGGKIKEADVASLILYHLWDRFRTQLIDLLSAARSKAGIPEAGGLLVFVGGLSKCLILSYEITGAIPELHIVKIVQDPKSVFDFWEALDHTDMAARNKLKNILGSGHKLVAHRNILIHVDRRRDLNVFGPSIDTLVLSEILAQRVFESQGFHCEIALEIGCGNGLLTTALANHSKTLRELFAIDISFDALACTSRNVLSSRIFSLGLPNPNPSTYFIAGAFQPELINRQFDIIVCNPPYVPVPPKRWITGQVSDYYQAVSGTALMQTVLGSIRELLKPGGKMLLMTSSLSLDYALSCVPTFCTVSRPLGETGFEVIFDVETVLNDEEWLAFLVEHCGLVSRDEFYYHTLHPLWVESRQEVKEKTDGENNHPQI